MHWRMLFGWVALLCLAALTQADTLVLKDGRRFTGEVTEVGGEFAIETRYGVVRIARDNVERHLRNEAPAPAEPPTEARRQSNFVVGEAYGILVDGQAMQARELFQRAITLDGRNPEAHYGAAMASLYLGEWQSAVTSFNRAETLGYVDERALVLNRALAQLNGNAGMRAVKEIREYIAANSAVPDEGLLNALAICLHNADDNARRSRLFEEAQEFHAAHNALLEKTRPGQKRWGVGWISAGEVEAKHQSNRILEEQAELVEKEIDAARRTLDDENAELKKTRLLQRRGLASDLDVKEQQARVNGFAKEVARRESDREAILSRMDQPDWPEGIELVPPVIPGSSAESIASADRIALPPLAIEPQATVAEDAPPQLPDPSPLRFADEKGGIVVPEPEEKGIRKRERPAAASARGGVRQMAAFPIAPDLAVTAAAPLEGIDRVKLQASDGTNLTATVVRRDAGAGLALLRLVEKKFAYFSLSNAFEGGEIDCVCFPVVNIFEPRAELVAGQAPPAGVNWQIKLTRHPRLPGGPLLVDGRIVGVELVGPTTDSAAVPAATLAELKAFLGDDLPKSPSRHKPDPVSAMLLVTLPE